MKAQRRIDWHIYCLSPNPWQKPKRFAVPDVEPKDPEPDPVESDQIDESIKIDEEPQGIIDLYVSIPEHRPQVKNKH